MRVHFDNWLKALPFILIGIVFFTKGHWLADQLRPWHLAAALAAGGLAGWVWQHRRYRRLADTPDISIAAAPQGYVRISGIGRCPAGTPLMSPMQNGLMALPCLWYRIKVEERDYDGDWQTTHETESDDAFLLIDEDGQQCIIEPAGAHVFTGNKEVYRSDDTRSTLWLLVSGTRLHAQGDFRSHSAHADAPDHRARLRDKLADWKESGETQRFDLDKNGEIDMQEWELARAAALREVKTDRVVALNAPASHSLSRPADGRDFIITDQDPAKLTRRLRWQAWACLILFFAGVSGLAHSFG